MLHSAVLYSEEEGKGIEGGISFIALLIFNRSIVLVLRLFCLFACLLLCVHKEVARNAPALHAGPRAFEKRGKQNLFALPKRFIKKGFAISSFGTFKLYVRRA